jgi:hypothetical protein
MVDLADVYVVAKLAAGASCVTYLSLVVFAWQTRRRMTRIEDKLDFLLERQGLAWRPAHIRQKRLSSDRAIAAALYASGNVEEAKAFEKATSSDTS